MADSPITELTYSFGNEHSPTEPFGRVEFAVAADGTARLDNHRRTGHRAWTATVPAGALHRVADALRLAGFPAAPRILPPAGSPMRLLTVAGDVAGRVMLPWYEARDLPGYADAFGVLDALVGQVSGGTVGVPAGPLPDPATDVREVT